MGMQIEDPKVLVGVYMVTQTKCISGGYVVSCQRGPSPSMEDVSCKHAALSGTTDEAIAVEPPRKQGAFFGTTSEVSMKESEAPCEVGVLSGATDEVFLKKGKAIPSLVGEATCEGEGWWKT